MKNLNPKIMKTVKQITSIFLLTTILFLSSCSGDDGEDGATGPQGEQGPQGDQGEQGEIGTANVIYSDWIDSEFDNPVTDGFDSFSIDAPEVTQEILDSGTILVYANSNSNTIYQVPVSFHGILNENYWFRVINTGTISIGVEGIGINNIGEPFLNNVFRYVIIPGGVSASAKSTVNYSKMTYKEIIEHFNIPE